MYAGDNNQEYIMLLLKTLDEFKQFCQQNLLHELQVFEARRQQVRVSVFVSISVFLILVYFLIQFYKYNLNDILSGLFLFNSLPEKIVILLLFTWMYIVAFFMILLAFTLFYNAAFETFVSSFDTKIIEKIFDFINTNRSFNISITPSEEDKEYTLSTLCNSQIFNVLFKPSYIKHDNLISGQINDIDIMFVTIDASIGVNHYWTYIFDINYLIKEAKSKVSETFTEAQFIVLIPMLFMLLCFRLIKGIPFVFNRVIRGQNIDYQRFQVEILRNEAYNTHVFKGLFFTAKFNKFAKAVTIIKPKFFKANIHSFLDEKKQLVKLEDPEFTKYFTVYSEDQVEARYVLSTNLMAKLVEFRKKARRNIYVSFVDDIIYIAIEYPEGIFEPNLFRSMLSFAPLREYFETIQLMFKIVEDLNLNRRIWKS
ncbi:hypothetical protein PCC6912_30180 [Chlorogloeopsis fritschii PCC 6912]|uniref:Galanin n=1 Tax=Chlorogloeopsis fritschii PCC 6912 TaxID=211165 RepID=A0A433NDM4_CHLFR|nr:hypothetical protein PCC6912_30180 [Chlorogloeopsis fritschii PCC 6912]